MLILGIDHYRNQSSTEFPRSWNGIKMFFKFKLQHLQQILETTNEPSAEAKVIKHASLAIKKGIERQLETVMFFSDDDSTKQDLSCVPLTNSCAESNFGKLNCALSQTSGSYVSLGPVSNKNILQSNPSETSLSSTEKKASLVWVRRSPEAKEYKLLVKEYQQKVKNSQDLMVMAKKEKKRIKLETTYKLLDQCKLHQGPVSPDNLDILDDLDEKQIMLEIRYLRITTCPNIRERFKLPSGKFQKLSQEELKAQIVNSLKPKPSEKNDLDQLFANLEGCLKFFFFFVCSSCFCLLTIQSINNNII